MQIHFYNIVLMQLITYNYYTSDFLLYSNLVT